MSPAFANAQSTIKHLRLQVHELLEALDKMREERDLYRDAYDSLKEEWKR